ncbi:MAG: DUF2510 domain-containing protein [Microbacteriaceae bacterium]|nr:DUF2510 domain-containing protein [Microbacteriaceae bacterium]
MTTGLILATTAPAGWYQINGQVRRWFDGRRWTEHYAPVLTRVTSERLGLGGENVSVGLHVMMVIMTLGAWLPVWGVLTALRGIRNRAFNHSLQERRVKLAPITA